VDSITEQLSQLQELADDQLSELESSVLTEFEATHGQDLTPQSVDKLEQLANAVEAVRTEKTRRVEAMEALKVKASEAATKVHGEKDVAEDANSDPEGLVDPAPEDEPADTKGDSAIPAEVPVPPTPEEKAKKPNFSDDTDKAAEAAVESEPAAEAAAETDKTAEAAAEAKPETEASAETATPETDTKPETEAASTEETDTAQEKTPEAEASTAEADGASEQNPAEASASASTDTIPEANVTATAGTAGDSPQIEAPADRRITPKPAAALMSITAGADIPGMSAGTKLQDSNAVAEAFQKRLHSLRHVHGGDGEQHIVASFAFEHPEDRVLEANDPQSNTDKIQKITAPAAITAAAGICLPLETNYEMHCDIGVTDRPIRDSLARFSADRGGIRYFSAPQLEDTAAATGFWRGDARGQNWATYGPDGVTATTPANQKPCLEVQCTDELTAFVEAVTLCLTFNNLTTRTFPELIKRHNDLALVAHARVAENHLLAQLEAGSTAVQAQAQVVGAAREIFNLLGRAVAQYRFKHRMNSVQPLRMIIGQWVMDMLRADLALQMPGDGIENTLAVAETQINTWFRSRGVNVTWHLDGVGPSFEDLDGAGAGTAKGFVFPDTIEFALFAEGTWLYLDGGTLDLGVIRDSGLVATNQYKQFVETFEGLANMGCDSYWVSAQYRPTGAAAALVETM